MPIPFVLTLVAVFATVALVSGSIASLALTRNAPERKRLRNLTAPRTSTIQVQTLELAEAPSPVVKRLSNMLPGSPTDLSRLRRRLAAAGYEQYAAAVWYSTARLALPVLLTAVSLLIVGVR